MYFRCLHNRPKVIRNASPSSPLMPALIPIRDSDDEDELSQIGEVFEDDDDVVDADVDADSVEVAIAVII